MSTLVHHYETSAFVAASVDGVFAHVDDHTRLSSHMSESSWMMGGGRMRIEVDDGHGQRVGSRIRLSARVFGLQLSVDQVVTERNPPHRKSWETIGTPRLLVIGQYRMGFEITSQDHGSFLRVHIDYALPENAPSRWLGYVLGRYYARWCTQRMVNDAARHFASPPKTPTGRKARLQCFEQNK
jgi:Polyketide cyclase / dehydrase and lipid transport